MVQFQMYANIIYPSSFEAFIAGEDFTSSDFILTSKSVYHKFIKPLSLPCGSLLIGDYGQGEPTTSMVDKIKSDIPQGVRRLIAIGGGSVMDAAKLASLHVSSGKTEDLFLGDEEPTRIYEVYAVPTTCGTGSEVTQAAAVELERLHTKRGLSNPLMFPVKAALIAELICDLPYRVFATSSIDALIHAAEAYLSPKASPISTLFSTEAMRLILSGYRHIRQNDAHQWTDRAADFLHASNFAGLAFSSAGCAAVHALSYPLGGGYHIPHGEANQLVFAATFRKYKENQPAGRINALEQLWGELMGVSADEAFSAVFALLDEIQPRRPLASYGIAQDELQGFAEGVMAGQARLLGNNYTPLTIADMTAIYQSIYA